MLSLHLSRYILMVSLVLLGFTLGCQQEPQQESSSHSSESGDSSAEVTTSDETGTEMTESTAEPTAEVDRTGQLLRHAVFFTFKEESSKEDVQSVIDAFAALEEKIDVIADFEWGTNNSPEKLDDGFTHCFLLSFKSEADRDAYIPHPAHKGDFADTLRPHMQDVFVVDYWGTPSENEPETLLRHVVFFKFKDLADPEKIKDVEEAFAALPEKIEAIKAFEWGTNNSLEGKNDDFTHCFLVTFDSEEGREIYLPHPDHQAFVEILKPVLDKVRVLDYFAQ